ncbi:hypothetical protein IWW36_000842 [Coemansia brasiliensis]|uniref:Uncharacterized protein n=1 Tax=Coemansia brasiliensis TaxID=2650707 RepID=A0A9W8IGG9_9FUNG|nr:hypothetical protein IWW36_000842 [Coemansia brasiliensis]
MKLAVLALAVLVVGTCAESDMAIGLARIPRRTDKMLRIPKDVVHMHRRQDESASESTTPEPSSTKEKPSSSHESPSPTPEKSSSEEGALESDSPDPEASGDNNDNSDGDNSDQQSQDIPTDAPTDAQGNPIITDVNVSHWSLIQPTGVSYMSGASRQTAGTLGIMGALIVAAMF